MPELQPQIVVGRDAELASLCDQIDAVRSGIGSLALISGEAGIGKTTLVHELSAQAKQIGIRSLRGTCYERVTPAPYGLWIELESACLALLDGANDERDSEKRRRPGSRDQLFSEMAASFTETASDCPLLLILDDIHWADSASLDFLEVFASRLRHFPIMVVCTYRDHEAVSNTRLNQILPTFARDVKTTRIELQPFDRQVTGELIARRYDLPSPDTGRLAGYLQQRAAGNPFFINEFLRTLEMHGVLAQGARGWQLGGLHEVPLPTLIQQFIRGRLGQFPRPVQRLLELAAVSGEQFTAAWLAQLGRVSIADVGEALSLAVEADLLIETPGTRYFWFSHPLIQETLYESIPVSQRYAWHREIAEHLAEQVPHHPERVAEHFARGQDFRAVKWLIEAGDHARNLIALNAAHERYELALEILDSYSVEPSLRGWLLIRSADACIWNDEQRGLRYLDEVIQISGEIDDPALLVASQWLRGKLRCLVGEDGLPDLDAAARRFKRLPDEARRAVVDGALRNVSFDDAEEFLEMSVTTYLAHYGHYSDALERVEDYMARKGNSDFRPKHAVYMTLGTVHSGLGNAAEAHEAYSLAREFNRQHNYYVDAANAARLELSTVHLVFEADLPHERERLAEQIHTLYRQSNEQGTLAEVPPEWGLLPLLVVEGCWHAARRYSDQMIERGGIWRRIAAPIRGTVARHQGDPDTAWSIIHQELPGGPWSKPSTQYYTLLLPLQRLAADLAIDDGDRQSARDWIASHQRWLAWSSRVPEQPEGHLLWARYHFEGGNLTQAHQHADSALQHAQDPRQPLAIVASLRMLADIALARGEPTEAERRLNAALALARECRALFEEALVQLSMVELAAFENDHKLVANLFNEIREITARLDAQPVLDRAEALTRDIEQSSKRKKYPHGLTPREVDVLQCVAAGMTDAEISTRLSISHRTVGAHLHSIYSKLDVPNRTAATSLAKDLDIV